MKEIAQVNRVFKDKFVGLAGLYGLEMGYRYCIQTDSVKLVKAIVSEGVTDV